MPFMSSVWKKEQTDDFIFAIKMFQEHLPALLQFLLVGAQALGYLAVEVLPLA